jgi:hypothetical protein
MAFDILSVSGCKLPNPRNPQEFATLVNFLKVIPTKPKAKHGWDNTLVTNSGRQELRDIVDRNCIKAASLHGIKPRLHQTGKSPWPQVVIAPNLQVSMASSHNCTKPASLHGIKPEIASNLQVSMAASPD